MADKDNRPKARLPRGFADRTAGEIRATDEMLRRIRGVYERYGFQPVETPLVEYTDSLGKFLPDQDRPNEGVFSFLEEEAAAGEEARKEDWLSLRYDLTAPLARYVAGNFDRLPKPYRSYRVGWVFRNEKPGPGRFRQFMQFDADTVGASTPAADAEMCMMMADALEEIGIARGQYVIKVNSRKVLDGVMEAIGIGGDAHAGRRLTVLRAIDKLDRLGIEGVRELLGPGRKDESGDFTKGAGLDNAQIERVLSRLTIDLGKGAPLDAGSTESAGLQELAAIQEMVRAAGYEVDRIRIDASVVRGLEYYTGAVFEAELLFETRNEKGEPARFGSVGGGGRYDGLVGRFRGEDVPATGFSIGVSRLIAALSALGKVALSEPQGPVVVTVMDRARIADYQRIVAGLRKAGLAAELYLGESGMKAQLKYADRRNSPAVVIQGEDERQKGVVQVKDLALGKQMAAAVADNAAWREDRPGQFEVAVADLVAALRKIVGEGT